MRIILRRFFECPRRCGAVAFLLTVSVLLTHYSVKYGLNTPPATGGDEWSYDIIGWNLGSPKVVVVSLSIVRMNFQEHLTRRIPLKP